MGLPIVGRFSAVSSEARLRLPEAIPAESLLAFAAGCFGSMAQASFVKLIFSSADVHYHYKLDEDTPPADDQNFDIEEALTACACLSNPGDCDFIYRVAANRDSLRSLEMVYPADQLQRSRHERVWAGQSSMSRASGEPMLIRTKS